MKKTIKKLRTLWNDRDHATKESVRVDLIEKINKRQENWPVRLKMTWKEWQDHRIVKKKRSYLAVRIIGSFAFMMVFCILSLLAAKNAMISTGWLQHAWLGAMLVGVIATAFSAKIMQVSIDRDHGIDEITSKMERMKKEVPSSKIKTLKSLLHDLAGHSLPAQDQTLLNDLLSVDDWTQYNQAFVKKIIKCVKKWHAAVKQENTVSVSLPNAVGHHHDQEIVLVSSKDLSIQSPMMDVLKSTNQSIKG